MTVWRRSYHYNCNPCIVRLASFSLQQSSFLAQGLLLGSFIFFLTFLCMIRLSRYCRKLAIVDTWNVSRSVVFIRFYVFCYTESLVRSIWRPPGHYGALPLCCHKSCALVALWLDHGLYSLSEWTSNPEISPTLGATRLVVKIIISPYFLQAPQQYCCQNAREVSELLDNSRNISCGF